MGPIVAQRFARQLSQTRFDRGKGVPDRVEVGTIGQKAKQLRARRLNGGANAGLLWLLRLFMMTTFLRLIVGKRTSSTQVWNEALLIGQSMTMGAVRPLNGSPPMNVIVSQCPCKIAACRRSGAYSRPCQSSPN